MHENALLQDKNNSVDETLNINFISNIFAKNKTES